DFLCDLEGVVDLDTEVVNRAFNPPVAQKELSRPQVADPAIDDRHLGPPHGMRGVFQRVEADAVHPFGDEARVLARGQGPIWAPATREQVLARLTAGDAKIIVEGLARRLGQLEANGTAGFPLPDICSVDGVAIGRHVIDAQCHEIAAAELAIDGQIEHRQIARALFKLQLGADGPDMTGPQRRFRAGYLALVPRWSRRAWNR